MGVLEELAKAAKGALHRADDKFWCTDMLPCGIAAVDWCLGGGVGYGRVTELIGAWSSGKTMLLYLFLAQNQRMGGVSILFEAEGAFNEDFYRKLGGDPSTLWVYNLETVEQLFDSIEVICDAKMKSKDQKPYALGWDSIAATATKHLMETDMGVRDMSKANAMDQGCKKIRSKLEETKIAVISTNQTREKIGSMDSAVHTPGGNAWPFLASQRVHLQFDGGDKSSKILSRDGTVEIGRWTKGKVIKNKLATPFGEFILPIYVEDGHWHPEYEEGTIIGIHAIESLFYNYLRKRIYLPDKTAIVELHDGGWYTISNRALPGGSKKFRKSEWPQIVKEYPWLLTYPYDQKTAYDLQANTAQVSQATTPEPPAVGT